GLADTPLTAMHFDEEARRLGQPEAAEAVQRADRAPVEKLDGSDVDPEADQDGGRPGGGPRVREGEATLPAHRGKPRQRQSQLGRDRQRSLRADEEAEEVITRRALAAAVAEADDPPGAGDHRRRPHVLS